MTLGLSSVATTLFFTKCGVEELLEQLACILPVFAVDAVLHLWSFYLPLYQPRLLQRGKMLADSGFGNGKFFVDGTEIAGVALCQKTHDGDAGRVSESLCQLCQGFGFDTILSAGHKLCLLFVVCKNTNKDDCLQIFLQKTWISSPNGGKDDHHGYLFLQLLRAVRRRRPKKRRTSVWGREVRRMAII